MNDLLKHCIESFSFMKAYFLSRWLHRQFHDHLFQVWAPIFENEIFCLCKLEEMQNSNFNIFFKNWFRNFNKRVLKLSVSSSRHKGRCYKLCFLSLRDSLQWPNVIKLFTAVIYGFRNKLGCLSLNTRLGWEGLPRTNTVAYYGNRKLISFMIQGPGPNVIKLFSAVIYGFS